MAPMAKVNTDQLASVVASFNILRPTQDGRHFLKDILKCFFLNEKLWKSIRISLKFVPNGAFDNIPALVQIIAWLHRRQAVIWNKDGLVYRRINASLGLTELMYIDDSSTKNIRDGTKCMDIIRHCHSNIANKVPGSQSAAGLYTSVVKGTDNTQSHRCYDRWRHLAQNKNLVRSSRDRPAFVLRSCYPSCGGRCLSW